MKPFRPIFSPLERKNSAYSVLFGTGYRGWDASWNHLYSQGNETIFTSKGEDRWHMQEELAGDRLNEPWAEGWNGDTQPLGYTQYTLHGYPKIGHVTYMCIMLSITSSYPCPTIKQAQFSDLGSNRIVKPKVQTLCMSTPYRPCFLLSVDQVMIIQGLLNGTNIYYVKLFPMYMKFLNRV